MQEPAELKTDKAADTASAVVGNPHTASIFDNRFQILAALGTGATGSVYKAKDPTLDRLVAIKVLHNHLANDEEAVQRFKKECLASMQLAHPNIAKVYSPGKTDDGKLYLVMDYIDGQSLEEHLAVSKKLEPKQFFEIFKQLIDALSYAHSQGIVHRDFKPGNILIKNLDATPQSFILDFGLAKWIDTGNDQNATKTGVLLGSTAYMSPEQCKGEKDIDQRADIYSFGCVMLEALTGECPFKDETVYGSMYKHLNVSLSKLQFLQALPEHFAKIIRKCLQKDKSKRYQSMSELNEEFSVLYDSREKLGGLLQTQDKSKRIKWKPLIATSLILICIFSFPTWNRIIEVKKAQRQKIQEKETFSKMAREKLRPPNEAILSSSSKETAEQSMEYGKSKEWGWQGAITFLERWCRQYKGRTDEDKFVEVWAALVRAYAKSGNIKEADHYASEVLSRKAWAGPHAAQIATDRARFYLAVGNSDKALELLDTVVRNYRNYIESNTGDYANLLGAKAECYESKHDYPRAILLLEQVNKKILESAADIPDMKDNEMRNKLILLLEKTGQQNKVQKYLEQNEEATKVSMKNDIHALADFLYQTGNLLLSCDDYAGALKYHKEAHQKYKEAGVPQNESECLLRDARIYQGMGDKKKAHDCLEEALSKLPVSTDKVMVLEALAVEADRDGNLQDEKNYARQQMECLDKLFKNNTNADFTAYEFAVNREIANLERGGDWEKGETLRDEWINKFNQKYGINPFSLNELLGKTQALMKLNKPDEALACVNQSLELLEKPEAVSSLARWGKNASYWKIDFNSLKSDIFKNMKNYPASIDAAQLVRAELKRSNDSNDQARMQLALLRLGSAYHLNKQEKEAESYYGQAAHLWRRVNQAYMVENAYILKAVSEYETEMGMYSKAKALLEECLQGLQSHYRTPIQDGMQPYYNGLGEILYLEKNYKMAISKFEKTEQISKNSGKTDLYYRHAIHQLWKCNLSSGEYAKAEHYARKYLETATDSSGKNYGKQILAITTQAKLKAAEAKQAQSHVEAEKGLPDNRTENQPDALPGR